MVATRVGKAASKYRKLAVLLALALTSSTRTRADHVPLDERSLVRRIIRYYERKSFKLDYF